MKKNPMKIAGCKKTAIQAGMSLHFWLGGAWVPEGSLGLLGCWVAEVLRC